MHDVEYPNPRIRDSVLVFERGEFLQFFCTMDLRVKEFRAPPFVSALIPLLDGTRTIDQLTSEVASFENVGTWEVAAVIEVLREERLIDRAIPEESRPEDRYSRQKLLFEEFIASFPELEPSASALQSCLSDSRVVIVGMGGAGSWVLQSLVAAGVGYLDIIDPDVVTVSNLNRQVLFEERECGTYKVDVAAAKMAVRNPGVTVMPHRVHIDDDADLEGFLTGTSLVINCADEPSVAAMSDLVSRVAHIKRIAHIVGGGYGGNLGIPGTTVVPGETVCWTCVRAATRNDHERSSTTPLKGRTREGGSIAPIAGIVGNLVAWEAIRILLGLPLSLANQVREMDLLTLDWRVRTIDARKDCENCHSLTC